MSSLEARNSGGVRPAEPLFLGLAGFLIVVAGTCLVALVVWESYAWYQQSMYPAKGIVPLRWTGAVFVVPIFGLAQPLVVLPAYFFTRHWQRRLACGLLTGSMAMFIVCLPLTLWLVRMMKALAGLR